MRYNDDNTKTPMVLPKGTMVAHYRIVEKIGAGGMGEVYLAEDTQLNRRVALKFMPIHMAAVADMRTRFTREAQAAAKLDHPNIVPVYEVGEFQDRPFIAMAHIIGQPLHDVIKDGKLSVAEAVDLVKQICEGLQHAHEAGVVHRDIKPPNIIVDKSNRARLVDFGLAAVTGEEKLTKTGSIMGTVGYMAPEQILGKKVDKRADLFSLGVILYEMISGRRPFIGDNDASLIRAILDSTPEPVARFKSGVTGELQQIIDKALAKDPSHRYQHADGMLADLKRLDIDSGQTKKSRATGPIGVAVITVAAIAVMLGVWMSRDEAEAPARTLRQITYFGDIQNCEISPDGLFYAYSREIGDQTFLYVSDFTGGNPVEILKCSSIKSFRWSPDGSELAVNLRLNSSSGTFLIPRLGGEPRKLTGGACTHIPLTWSPGGDRLAQHNVCSGFDSITIVQVSPVTISKIPLPVKGEWSRNLDWSKDGKRLLFTSNESSDNALWTIPLDGQDPVEVLDGDFPAARWSSDGKAIYYVESVGQGTGPLMKMKVDENTGGRVGDPRELLPDLDAMDLSISENNDHLLFSRKNVSSNLWYTPIGEAGQGESKQLTFGTAIASSPAISPDGQSLTYALEKGGRTDIYLLPIDGGNPKRLTFDSSRNLGPAWSPDGKEVAYWCSTDGHDYSIKIMNLRSGKSRTFPSPSLAGESALCGLHWGADGNIYYQKPGNRNIILFNAESGAQRELIQDEKVGWVFYPRESPDGKSVAVNWNNHVKGRGIYLLSLTDTTQVCILYLATLGDSRGFSPLDWSPDGEWLYCYDAKNLYRLHHTGSKLETLGITPLAIDRYFDGAEADPALTPDLGAYISVEVDSKTDVWLVDNFDPYLK